MKLPCKINNGRLVRYNPFTYGDDYAASGFFLVEIVNEVPACPIGNACRFMGWAYDDDENPTKVIAQYSMIMYAKATTREIVASVEPADIPNMTGNQKDAVLAHCLEFCKRYLTLLICLCGLNTFAAVTTDTLGNLKSSDTVVTDVTETVSEEEYDDTTNRLSNVENQTASIARLVMGESVILESTNYNSKVNIPTLSVKFKLKDEETGSNYWYTVWNEMGWVNYFLDKYLPTNFYYKAEIDSMLDQKADRAWGFYDSHTGGYAPDGFTWISSPNIAIAGNLSYQRVVTSAGAVFVLCNNGLTTLFGTDQGTNGWLRISDDKGNALFEITKGTERTEGANAQGISVYTGGADGLPHLVIPYHVSSRPTLRASKDLKTWKYQDDEDTYINVNWTSEESGNFVADVANLTGTSPLFITATYKVGAKDMVKNFAPISVEGGIYCEDGKTLIVPYIDGGEVKWKIKTN